MQLRATRAGSIGNRRPAALTLSQLLPSGAGRVAAIYSDPARPSYDECIAKNVAAIAAGRPQDCVLFADAAGQTPVVYPIGAGQGKGLLLDRSAGLVRGAELVTNGDFSSGTTGWTPGNSPTFTVSSGVATVQNSIGSESNITQPILTIGKWYEVFVTRTAAAIGPGRVSIGGNSISLAAGVNRFVALAATVTFGITTNSAAVGASVSVDNISVRELLGHHQQQPTAAARGEFSRRYNQLLATATLATQSITAIAAQYRLYFTGAGTVTLSGAATGVYSAGSHLITCTAGSLTLTVAGSVLTADCRFEEDATIGLPAYQRVTTASDYDETGFPTYWRAVTDDWAKSRMNPAGATKAVVLWAGQKMSDASVGILLEWSANSGVPNGSIRLTAANPANTYDFVSRGATSSAAVSPATYATPNRAALIGSGDIANDIASITVNGTTTPSTGDQGTGTYTEQDVYFGARAGTSLFANIREYAPPTILFLQPADSLSASHLAKLQKGYAKAVGVTL